MRANFMEKCLWGVSSSSNDCVTFNLTVKVYNEDFYKALKIGRKKVRNNFSSFEHRRLREE